MSEQKSLKQIFIDICDTQVGCPDPNESIGCELCVAKAVKEWLQQKKKEMPHLNHYCLDELLEELEK